MSTEAIGAAAPETTIVTGVAEQSAGASSKQTGLHSPPDSNNAMNLDGSDSELSDIDEVADKLNDKTHADDSTTTPAVESAPTADSEPKVEVEVEDIGEIFPDHYSGTVPVFKPTWKQFRDFKLFMEKVDQYGMKSGIIKIIPPQEWKDSLPPLDDMVKQIRVREPIKQDIMGSNGTYRQVNILHGRSYNLPQWRQLCDQSEHQPPARRGERRANAEKHKPAPRTTRSSGASKSTNPPGRKRKGRATRGSAKAANEETADAEDRPMTPVSPPPEKEEVVESVEQDPGVKEEDQEDEDDDAPVARRMGFVKQPKAKTQSTSARRKYQRREGSARIDEEAFKDWDYRMDVSDYTPERCEELERIYWKTLTYAPPLYGADLMGTLFHESLDTWNLNKLPNLLDVLGTKVPGVNTAYLYLGMWKATFAWHLEDVDLYSINYLHFGAPKQWYSISQADARRFEAAMKNIWPTEAKACDQFLRHKAFLISPAHLKQNYGITVNKCLSYPGEFVVTYPYGYHSGYNLGYNCAEAVNFALDSWLPMGKIAKKCQCAQAQDSVWVDVYEIERKLRGEETEYEETEDEEEEEDDEDENDTGLPSPPSSHTVRVKAPERKRKRAAGGEGERKAKKIRLRLKSQVEPPCCLCPHDIPGAEMMPTDDGRQAHRMCALYLPETYIETVDDKEVVVNIAGIDKARLELKCLYCRSKKGTCFQCSQKKCPRAYHATCAAAAGVFVEEAEVPVIGEDGTEYKEQAFEFSCRFHRTKRDRKFEGEALEDDKQIREAAAALKKNDICQIQYFRGDIFAGVVLENRHDEETLLLHVIPNGDHVEVEWKWLLLPDPADFRLPKASPNAIPLPTSRKAQKELNAKRPVDDTPRKDDEFCPGFTWAEFHAVEPFKNSAQVQIDLSKENQIWHYLGKTSTELRAQYTEDVAKPLHNVRSSFLDSIPKPPKPAPMAAPPKPKRAYSTTFPTPGVLPKVSPVPLPGTVAASMAGKQEKSYMYKPRQQSVVPGGAQFAMQQFAPKAPPSPLSQAPMSQGMPQLQPHQFAQPPPPPQPQRQLAYHPPAYHQQALQPRQGPQVAPQPQQGQQHQYHFQQPTLQIEQYQPPTVDPRPKKPSTTFSSDRFAPVGGINGFPQLPGLTWPPAHMKSGHHTQPQSRVWPPKEAAANGPPPTPMTSSAITSLVSAPPQHSSAGAQPMANAHLKYTFFKIHNNRDYDRYRTPYGQGGGFANGYENNHRAFLIKAQRALSGDKTPFKPVPQLGLQPLQPRPTASPVPENSASARYGSPYSRLLPRPDRLQHIAPQFFADVKREPSPAQYLPARSPSTAGFSGYGRPDSVPPHPMFSQQLGSQFGSWPQSPASQIGERIWPAQSNSPAPSSRPLPSRPSSQHAAVPKIQAFAKQSHSPIPLPPYAKLATASSGSNPGSPSLRTPTPKSIELATGNRASPGQHVQAQPPESQQPPVGVAAQVPPQDAGHHNSAQPPPWAPPYEAQGSSSTRRFELGPSTYPVPQPPSPTQYYQPPEQQQAQHAAQYNGPPTGYPGAPAVDASTDSVDVQRLIANLRRASQMGRAD